MGRKTIRWGRRDRRYTHTHTLSLTYPTTRTQKDTHSPFTNCSHDDNTKRRSHVLLCDDSRRLSEFAYVYYLRQYHGAVHKSVQLDAHHSHTHTHTRTDETRCDLHKSDTVFNTSSFWRCCYIYTQHAHTLYIIPQTMISSRFSSLCAAGLMPVLRRRDTRTSR